MEAANETETLVQDSFTPETDDPMVDQMSVSTEILIHLSAYLALFVFAVYVDQWVECFSDFRRNQMVTYGEAIDMKMLRFRQRFGKRRRDSEADTETDDNLPLLVLESPAPTSRPAFTFEEGSESEIVDNMKVVEEKEVAPEEIVVVTVPLDVVQEIGTSPPESPVELEEIPLE
ncbi:S-adenosylmethionine:tRNA ribosyltransferase-isomerase [Phytophthora palmivora]|uniref:S-adenosylmethionine:tRNA ribosyltransferase-isomerase n=1 Tax=Phytophthora palmivora TaxID=4796 RepID=A0A2P4Y5W0_9STRA|nr:S-adenosylmethionine:tRNA ribosyltransferase-isomerase [Phytophthora palmivora]